MQGPTVGLRSLGAAEFLGRLLRLLNASTPMCFPLITPASKTHWVPGRCQDKASFATVWKRLM